MTRCEIVFVVVMCGPEEERSGVVAISQTCAPSKKSASRIGVADKPASDACFNDWKRFCFVLREIASGENGRPLPGFEAQMRAQGVLVECGYTWPGRAEVHKPIVGHAAAPGDHNPKAPVEPHLASAGAKLKSAGEVQSRSGPRRSDPPPSAHCCERRPRASSLAPTYRAL
jgi:hypothetical protein